MQPASDIVLIGPMGSGKSTVAKLLATRLGWEAVDLDALIEHEAGQTIAEIFRREHETGFRKREHSALVAALGGRRVIATGGGVVLDARNRALIEARSVCIWLDATAEALGLRLHSETARRPLLHGVEINARLQELDAVRRPLYEETARLRVDTSDADAETVARRIATELDGLQ